MCGPCLRKARYEGSEPWCEYSVGPPKRGGRRRKQRPDATEGGEEATAASVIVDDSSSVQLPLPAPRQSPLRSRVHLGDLRHATNALVSPTAVPSLLATNLADTTSHAPASTDSTLPPKSPHVDNSATEIWEAFSCASSSGLWSLDISLAPLDALSSLDFTLMAQSASRTSASPPQLPSLTHSPSSTPSSTASTTPELPPDTLILPHNLTVQSKAPEPAPLPQPTVTPSSAEPCYFDLRLAEQGRGMSSYGEASSKASKSLLTQVGREGVPLTPGWALPYYDGGFSATF